MVRDCRKLHDDLVRLLEQGDIGILGRPLVELAVAAAVATNALEVIPRTRYLSDALARELDMRLGDLDEAVAETLRLPPDRVLAHDR
jgi:hypothetical protein